MECRYSNAQTECVCPGSDCGRCREHCQVLCKKRGNGISYRWNLFRLHLYTGGKSIAIYVINFTLRVLPPLLERAHKVMIPVQFQGAVAKPLYHLFSTNMPKTVYTTEEN